MKYLFHIVVCILTCYVAIAQEKATFKPIFEDLPIDDPAENSIIEPGENPADKIKKNIFAKAAISKRQCFVGEPILLTYQLFSSLQSNSRVHKKPALFGCTIIDLETNNEMPVYKKVNGRNYRVFDVARLQLVPVQTGVFRIDPIVVENKVSYKTDNKSNNYSGNVLSEAIEFSVKPLPRDDQSTKFSGLVGDFQVRHLVTQASIPKMETDTLKIVISGSGNFSSLQLPELEWPPGVQVFPALESQDLSEVNFPTTGTRIISYPFMPKSEGALEIGKVAFTSFSPGKSSYVVHDLSSLQVSVTPAVAKPEVITEKVIEEKHMIPAYIWVLLGVAVVSIILLLVKIRRNNERTPQEGEKIEATETVTPRPDYFSEIKSLEAVSDPQEFISHFKTLLIQYIRDRLKDESSSEEKLIGKMHFSAPGEFARIHPLYEQCNFLLYAPANLDVQSRQQMLRDFVSVVEEFPVE